MNAFFKTAKKVLRVSAADWPDRKAALITEMYKFRNGIGPFVDTRMTAMHPVPFWEALGYETPNMKKLMLALTPCGCASGSPERNWKACKNVLTKVRNKLGRETLRDIVFLRTCLRLKQARFDGDMGDFKPWLTDLLKKMAGDDDDDNDSDDGNLPFMNFIEPGEQEKIDGTGGAVRRGLVSVKQNQAFKGWLYNKYKEIHLVDKNPEGKAGEEDLEDPEEWEHRLITDIKWIKRVGWGANTKLYGIPVMQDIQTFHINTELHRMIGQSPHNTRPMQGAPAAIGGEGPGPIP